LTIAKPIPAHKFTNGVGRYTLRRYTYGHNSPIRADREGWRAKLAGLGFFVGFPLFDVHVLEFTGFKDLTAFEAFDELGIFVAGNNLDARVPTLLIHGFAQGRVGRLGLD
jgi:hypothetical protein